MGADPHLLPQIDSLRSAKSEGAARTGLVVTPWLHFQHRSVANSAGAQRPERRQCFRRVVVACLGKGDEYRSAHAHVFVSQSPPERCFTCCLPYHCDEAAVTLAGDTFLGVPLAFPHTVDSAGTCVERRNHNASNAHFNGRTGPCGPSLSHPCGRLHFDQLGTRGITSQWTKDDRNAVRCRALRHRTISD